MKRIILTAAVALLLLTACSSTDGPSVATAGGGAGASASPSLDKAEANRRFAKCMREHGVEMPDPRFDADGRVWQPVRDLGAVLATTGFDGVLTSEWGGHEWLDTDPAQVTRAHIAGAREALGIG